VKPEVHRTPRVLPLLLLPALACHELEPFPETSSPEASVPDAGDLDGPPADAPTEPDAATPDPDAAPPDAQPDALRDAEPPEPDMAPDAEPVDPCLREAPDDCETIDWAPPDVPLIAGFVYRGVAEDIELTRDGLEISSAAAVGMFTRFLYAVPWDADEGGIDFTMLAEYTGEGVMQPPTLGMSVAAGDGESAVVVFNPTFWDTLQPNGAPTSRPDAHPIDGTRHHAFRLVLDPAPPEGCNEERSFRLSIDGEPAGEWPYDQVSGVAGETINGGPTVGFGQMRRVSMAPETFLVSEVNLACAVDD